MNTQKAKKRQASEAETDQGGGKKKKIKTRTKKHKCLNQEPVSWRNTLSTDAPRVSGAIDGKKFAAARVKEMNALHSAVKNASYALHVPPFPELTRFRRRRAASHNLSGPSARLRAKTAQKNEVKRKTAFKPSTKSKHSMNDAAKCISLETHAWHVKRTKMVNIWGYNLGRQTMLKSSRTNYNSLMRSCTVHDASYYGCIELKGDPKELVKILNTMTDPSLPSIGSARYINGCRIGYTYLYEYIGYPTKLISPMNFLWRQCSADTDHNILWIWIHAAAYSEAFSRIKQAIEVRPCLATSPKPEIEIYDRRQSLVRFELTGPQSTTILQSILSPVNTPENPGRYAVWKDLKYISTLGMLPRDVVIGLTVDDPRLKFPQKPLSKTRKASTKSSAGIKKMLMQWPLDVARSDIWDDTVRSQIFDSKLSEFQLAKRRGKNLLPGSKLEPTVEDSQIPLLLIQREGPIFDRSGPMQKHHSGAERAEGWTVILPRGWGTPFWMSLIFAGARAASLEDARSMAFESGRGCFPFDTPGCHAFKEHQLTLKEEAKCIWQRKPPAKRINFSKLDREQPFEAAFETLISSCEGQDSNATSQLWNNRQRPSEYVLRGKLATALLDGVSSLEPKISELFLGRGIESFGPLDLTAALFKVRVIYLGRGQPECNAMIYLVDNEEDYKKHVMSKMQQLTVQKRTDMSIESPTPIQEISPPRHCHIGYLTTGKFSLAIGHGFGVGACTALGIQRMQAIDKRQDRKIKMLVLIRNPNAVQSRPAQLEVIY